MDFRDVIDRANDCLLFRRFEECLDVCRHNIEVAKNYIEDERACAAIEALVAIAIQAYAELNRWLEVVPFVAQTYNGLEECPPLIARLCLSLHAKLKDDVTCTVIASIWLKNPTNCSRAEYRSLAEAYVMQVLLPAQRWDDVRNFLDTCPGVDEAYKLSCLRQVRVYRQRCEEKAADRIEVIESASSGQETVDSSQSGSADKKWTDVYRWMPQWLVPYYNSVKLWIQKTVPLVPLQVVRNVCILIICLYFITSRWRHGLVKSAAVLRLWTLLGTLWRSMFGPFYMISNS
jgi:hypothetical protein